MRKPKVPLVFEQMQDMYARENVLKNELFFALRALVRSIEDEAQTDEHQDALKVARRALQDCEDKHA